MTAYRGRGAFTTWPDEMLADYLADGLMEQATESFMLACSPQWEASGYASHEHDGYRASRAPRAPDDDLQGGVGLHLPSRPARPRRPAA